MKTFSSLSSHSAPVPPPRSMFSNRVSCCMSLVLLSAMCRQTLGYIRRSSGQKYLVKTGNKSPAKHLLVETEDSDYDPEEYDSVEGKIYCSFKDFYLLYLLFSKKSYEGNTKMERGHDYVDYDSPDVFCSKFLVVLLCFTNETLGFLFENFSEASGPEKILL